MIKHIAMFKFKAFESEEEKEKYQHRLKEAFAGLDEKISEIKFLQIGFDLIHSEASYDFVVNVDINSLDDLAVYAKHPLHVQAVEVIKEMAIDRKSIDYEF